MSVPNNGRLPVSIPRVTEPVPIILDDQERTLRMTFYAMKVIQEKTGIVMWRPGAFEIDTLDPVSLGTIIWAGLLHESPDLTLDEVLQMPYFTMGNFHYILDRLLALWGETVVPVEESTSNDTGPKELNEAMTG